MNFIKRKSCLQTYFLKHYQKVSRLIMLIIGTTIFCSFSSSEKDLIIKLHPENGYGVFMPGNLIMYPGTAITYKGVPKGIKEFVIRSMALEGRQYYRESNISCDNTILILVGTNQEGNRVIIVDSDNDEDFSNETILEYEFPLSKEEQKKIRDSLPTVLTSYEYFHNGKVITKSINVRPSPYRGSLGLKYDIDDEIEKKYDLFISFPEYRKGETTVDNTKYKVFVSNGFTSLSYSMGGMLSVFFSESNEKEPSQSDGDIPYQIGDIVNLKGHDYLLDGISFWGDTLKLKYIGENDHPTGITEGKLMPEFEAKKLDNSVFSLEQYPGKYVLLDFWGTWCNPCIASIPELKELNSEFKDKNFVLVSVAFDKDVQKVADFAKKEEMNWEHVFVDRSQPSDNSLVKRLKVTSFPTTILIAPDGRILARNKKMDELREILKNVL